MLINLYGVWIESDILRLPKGNLKPWSFIMAKMTEDNPTPPHRGGPIAVENKTLDVPHAPVIFFDAAPNSGNVNGTVTITLSVGRQLSHGADVKMDFVAAGFLRCSVVGALQLRQAIDNALALASTPPASDAKKLN